MKPQNTNNGGEVLKPAANLIDHSASNPVIPASAIRADLGSSRATVYRYIKNGHLEAVHIYGKLFITRASYDRFIDQALRGELASPSVKTRTAKATAARKQQ